MSHSSFPEGQFIKMNPSDLFSFLCYNFVKTVFKMKPGIVLKGDMGEVVSQNCPTPQGEMILHRIYRKNIPKDYHFS